MPNKKLKIKNLVFVIAVITIAGIIVFYMATNNSQTNSNPANQALVGQTLSPELSQQISN